MGIEFICTQCGKLLRTPDDSAGKRAKCPECGAVLPVPATSEARPAAAPIAPTPYASPNPFQSPVASTQAPAQVGPIVPTVIDIGDALSRTWEIYKSRLWPLVGMCLLALVVNAAIIGAAAILFALAGSDLSQQANTGVPTFIFWVTNLYLQIGLQLYMLNTARGEDAEVSDLFAGGRHFFTVLGAAILYILAAFAGFILLIFPMFIVLLMFSQFVFVIIDPHAGNAGAVSSLGISRQITRGNKLTLLALGLLMAAAGGMLFVLTCGIGYFFFQPFVSLAMAVAYTMMCGQRTADQMMVPAMP